VTGGLAEDWLVTPGISIPAGPIYSLNFYEKQLHSDDYGSQYFIKVSTTSQTDQSTFENIANYGESTFGTSYSLRSIDLSSYSGQVIYIAFIMVQDDGDNWYIDNISISDTPSVTDVTWSGLISSDWNDGSNWLEGNVPTIYQNAVIPSDCPHYPVVDGNASSNDLIVEDSGTINITNGANLNINGNFFVGSGSSGSFTINGGNCIVAGDFFTEFGSSIHIAGGIFNIRNWARNMSNLWSAGEIVLSDGTINASGSIRLSSVNANGMMNGPFTFNVGDDFYLSADKWSTVTGGTINLLGTGTAPFNFWPPNSTSNSVAYNLNINAANETYSLCRSDASHNLTVNNNFTVTGGTVEAFNGSYTLSTFDINGNLTLKNGAALNCDGINDPNIHLAGNWINNGGSFFPGNNMVILDGANQTLSGTNEFYNLTKTAGSDVQLTFSAGTYNRTTVGGTLNLQGSSDQLLSLASSVDGTQWEVDPQGTRVLNYLDVKDSKNINTSNINACTLVNSGNNTNWDFPVEAAGIISGSPIVCQNQSGVIYSAPVIASATAYLWSMPAGAMITAGDNTNNITVSFSLTAVSGNITVLGTNSCGNGPVSPDYPLTVNLPPTAPTIESIIQPTCSVSTGSVILGSLPFTGSWTLTGMPGTTITSGTGTSTTIPGLASGSYVYTVTNASGCTSENSGAVVINAPPEIPSTPVITLDGNILHSSSTDGNQWYNQNGLIAGATNQDYTVTSDGDYYVIVTIGECSSDPSNLINVIVTWSNESEMNSTAIIIYPNPARDYIIVNTGNYSAMPDHSIKILNMQGEIVFDTKIAQPNYEINLSTWSGKGVYVLQVHDNKNVIIVTRKIILL
jgi:hypothetical protein